MNYKSRGTVSHWFQKLVGSPSEFTLQERLLALMCLISIVGLLGAVVNIFLGYSLTTFILPLVFAIVFFIFYYLIRFKKYPESKVWYLVIILQIPVSIAYFLIGGSNGSALISFVIPMVFIPFLSKRRVLFLILMLNIVALFVIEYFFPEIIIQVEDSTTKLLSALVVMIFLGFFVYLSIHLFREAFMFEQYKNELHQELLKKQHDQILLMSELERKNSEQKIDYFTRISHEIRTPLSLLNAPLEMLIEKDKNRNHQLHYKMIKDNLKNLNTLVNNVLDFEKREVENSMLENKKLDVVSFVKILVNSFKKFAVDKNSTLFFFTNIQSYEAYFNQIKLSILINSVLILL